MAKYTDYLVSNPAQTQRILNSLADYQKEQASLNQQKLIFQNRDEIFSDKNSTVIANPAGTSTIVMFTDPNCAYCLQFFDAILNKKNITGSNVKLISKEIPILGVKSVELSRFLLSLQPEDYVNFYKAWSSKKYKSPEELLGDFRSNSQKNNSSHYAAAISQNLALAQKLNINSTPTFVYQDRIYRGYSNEVIQLLTK